MWIKARDVKHKFGSLLFDCLNNDHPVESINEPFDLDEDTATDDWTCSFFLVYSLGYWKEISKNLCIHCKRVYLAVLQWLLYRKCVYLDSYYDKDQGMPAICRCQPILSIFADCWAFASNAILCILLVWISANSISFHERIVLITMSDKTGYDVKKNQRLTCVCTIGSSPRKLLHAFVWWISCFVPANL